MTQKSFLPFGPLLTIAALVAIVMGGAAWQNKADIWSDAPVDPADVPQLVRDAPRYTTVVRLADEMDALIGQLGALSRGELLDMQRATTAQQVQP